MDVTWIKRNEYWSYFLERYFVYGEGGGHGVTGPRLRKIKETILKVLKILSIVKVIFGE